MGNGLNYRMLRMAADAEPGIHLATQSQFARVTASARNHQNQERLHWKNNLPLPGRETIPRKKPGYPFGDWH